MDFPLPETPVTQVNVPVGILRFTLFKLFPLAPLIYTNLPFLDKRRDFGISIVFLFARY